MTIASEHGKQLATLKAQREPDVTVGELTRTYGLSQAEAIRVLAYVAKCRA